MTITPQVRNPKPPNPQNRTLKPETPKQDELPQLCETDGELLNELETTLALLAFDAMHASEDGAAPPAPSAPGTCHQHGGALAPQRVAAGGGESAGEASARGCPPPPGAPAPPRCLSTTQNCRPLERRHSGLAPSPLVLPAPNQPLACFDAPLASFWPGSAEKVRRNPTRRAKRKIRTPNFPSCSSCFCGSRSSSPAKLSVPESICWCRAISRCRRWMPILGLLRTMRLRCTPGTRRCSGDVLRARKPRQGARSVGDSPRASSVSEKKMKKTLDGPGA